MARKMTALKYSQEFDGQTEMLDRRPAFQMMPYLVPFQPQPRIHPVKRRLEIAIEVKAVADIPAPVKIIHNV
jgi:hypothetical protein